MRKSTYVIAAIMLIWIGAAHAGDQRSRWASPDNPTAKAITALERMWMDTTCGAPPQPALQAAVAEDFMGTSVKGQRHDKSKALDSGNNRDCQLQQIRIHLFGDSLAIAYGNESSVAKKQDGTEWKRCLAWTDTWLNRKGKWQIIANQDDVVTCK